MQLASAMSLSFLSDAGAAAHVVSAPLIRHAAPHQAPRHAPAQALVADETADIVVIGSGYGGLSCAALLASRGKKVAVLEQHYEIGGCAHEYSVGMDGQTIPSAALAKKPDTPVFKFEVGPSLYAGLSPDESPNPLKHVFQMIEEEPEWLTYDLWGAHLPEVPEGYELSIGADNFKEILRRYGGPTALEDWDKLANQLRPLATGVMGLPSTAVRGDAGVLLTLGLQYPKSFFKVLGDAPKILAPFDLDALGVKDQFLKNYLDMIAFLLQGLPADGTLTAVRCGARPQKSMRACATRRPCNTDACTGIDLRSSALTRPAIVPSRALPSCPHAPCHRALTTSRLWPTWSRTFTATAP